ncbi:MAG: peptidase M22 glycoprotease [Candidatus Magasanikbacteria bacterium GW2011_GWA2_37_8]|uniref:Peptidase M22 glycoprotease n=1 Tax=Candidatus Magasanikbacteria bacterium GW2011_GWA2_37_8 TaxID=1619036 RepID=A0A0G0KK07_9BACT|nr:MAG: peptidase M22 glycoprotease [Candidatus Magasanikbacteria bacterium GW2011_GWA2_37_8]
MFLALDNSDEDKIDFYFFNDNYNPAENSALDTKWVQHSVSVSGKGLLELLTVILEKNNISIKDLSGLAVLIGRGRFTATRIAVTVANTIAYSLQIPIIGVSDFNWNDLSNQIKNTPVGQLVSATYSGEANIGSVKCKS